MLDLSLHILDLIENSVRAGATAISIYVEEKYKENSLIIAVEDNGCGMDIPFEKATDPFYTTKPNKKTGLGLGLFRNTAEEAGGYLSIGKSKLGGLAVTAVMRLRHMNRRPIGDLAATVSGSACVNPQVSLRCKLSINGKEYAVNVSDMRRNAPGGKCSEIDLSEMVYDALRDGLELLGPVSV